MDAAGGKWLVSTATLLSRPHVHAYPRCTASAFTCWNRRYAILMTNCRNVATMPTNSRTFRTTQMMMAALATSSALWLAEDCTKPAKHATIRQYVAVTCKRLSRVSAKGWK